MKTKVPHKEPHGKYEVWHKVGGEYEPVAYVECGNLLAALILPLATLDTPRHERVTPLPGAKRDTTIGDVIVNPEGAAYRIDRNAYGLCFQPIDWPQAKEREGAATLRAILNEPSRPQQHSVRSEDRGR